MKRILAVVAATLGLLVSAGQATASGPADSALQLAAQAAANAQGGGAQSGASQSQPANRNISVRVQSPGNAGDVAQSNTVASGATATNANATGQSANQAQAGPGACCGGGTQAAGQNASSSQSAAALSYAVQHGPSNENIDVRVQSPGNSGDVSQSNTAVSGAAAGNANATGQSANQISAAGSGTQAVGQDAGNEQAALAASSAEQTGAKNSNISVRVQSGGNDGDVEQSNTVASAAQAANRNGTTQGATQAQGGSGGLQAIGQDAKSEQTAGALSSVKQSGASNEHIAVRVQSPGNAGTVTQSNTVLSAAAAGNVNGTAQHAAQAQAGGGCKCGSGGTQAIGQDAKNHQGALAVSAAEQKGASNSVTPVRVDSNGNDGDVSQSSTVASTAIAANLNGLEQKAGQLQAGGDCKCSGGTQAIGQDAKNEQAAGALSSAIQLPGHDCRCGASGGNSHAPVRVDSSGGGGSVEQANTVASGATALNLNGTKQEAGQLQSGGGIQALGQEATSSQAALAASLAAQAGASNSSTPVRVDSDGNDGSVKQSNTVLSAATAANANLTGQGALQLQAGSCGCHGLGIQALGQKASNHQAALALSAALQHGASNAHEPVLVGSRSGGGSVTQSNGVASGAHAGNASLTAQHALQLQALSCGCGGALAIQALGQDARNAQLGVAASLAQQCGAGKGSSAQHHRYEPDSTPDARRWQRC